MIDTEPAVPGARDVAEVLRSDPLFSLLGMRLTHPIALGCVLFVIVLAAIVFGPSNDSRFIYTDF